MKHAKKQKLKYRYIVMLCACFAIAFLLTVDSPYALKGRDVEDRDQMGFDNDMDIDLDINSIDLAVERIPATAFVENADTTSSSKTTSISHREEQDGFQDNTTNEQTERYSLDSDDQEEDSLANSAEESWKRLFFPVPESDVVEDAYFDDAVFLGDSRVVGLMLYSGLTKATFYSEKAISITNLLTKEIVNVPGSGKISVVEALKQRRFAKVYIKVGLNELGWRNTDIFIQAYTDTIKQIRALQPGAVVYVQSILPVSVKKDQDLLINNARICEFNALLKKMCYDTSTYFLDVYPYMLDEAGFLPDEASSDGVHLNKEYCQLWLTYLKHHAIQPEVYE